jgi:hypothetical protein
VAGALALECGAVAWALEPGIERPDDAVILGGRGAEGGPGARSEIPLHAVGADDLPMMHQLFRFGVDPVLADSGGSGALAVALSRDGEPAARLLRESGTDPDDGDLSPLERAVRAGTKDKVALLIERGADLNVLSREGQPMMPLAVALGRADITAALLGAGADVDTPVVSPASEEYIQLVPGKYARFYLTRDQGLTPLMIAVLRGDLEIVRMLLKRGASLGPTHGQVKYPLGMAADLRNVPMMQVLLGRDPDEAANARRIVISIRGQQATLYEHGEPTLRTRVSTGRKGYQTPHGEYVITDKRRIWQSTLYDAEMPYFMRLSGSDIGLHAGVVPRGPASHGCIRLPAAAARNLYQRMRPGDPVTIAP